MRSLIGAAEFKFSDNLNATLEAGYRKIQDEILFDGATFTNGVTRDFSYLGGKATWKVWKTMVSGGGQISDSKLHISPGKSFYAQLRYHDVWLKGALV